MTHTTPLGEPIGAPLPDWSPPAAPTRMLIEGRYCRLEPIDPARHTKELFQASTPDDASASRTG